MSPPLIEVPPTLLGDVADAAVEATSSLFFGSPSLALSDLNLSRKAFSIMICTEKLR
jgi:hypothetical protein